MAKKPGTHSDGGGLALVVREEGSASWVYRYMLNRRASMRGLGRWPDVSLKRAREKAAEARALRGDGIDPVEDRRRKREEERAKRARAVTFDKVASDFLKTKVRGSNAKHVAQWKSTIDKWVIPVIGAKIVEEIGTAEVLSVLQQDVEGASFWDARPETASRVRGRIEAILDYGKTKGVRSGENPAAWAGNLKLVLPARSSKDEKHHAALTAKALPGFIKELRAREALAARALEFAILTAARTGEIIGAKWGEIDFERKTWIVPKGRMKGKREHRVPLSDRAIAILAAQKPPEPQADSFVFAGADGGPLSNMAFLALLKRMDVAVTAHGFRSTFRDWCGELTSFPSDLAEAALAHTLGGKTQLAYQRGDLFERRRELMTAWASYCGGTI